MSRSLRARTRPLRHGLAALALRALFGALRRLPIDAARRVGAGLGRFIGLLARGERRRMTARLRRALPDPPPVGDCWASLGRRAVELALADRLLDRVEIPPAARAAFDAARADGRGVLVATAHLGNWELMAAALAARGFPVHAIAARRQSGPLHAWLAAWRARLGVTVHPPGGGARAVIARLREGGVAAVFVDQATAERSRPIRFFGRPAPTPLTFERLRALTGAAPLFVACLPAGRGYRVIAEPIAGLDALTARIEALVRAHPAEWVWLHDRWRDDGGGGRLRP